MWKTSVTKPTVIINKEKRHEENVKTKDQFINQGLTKASLLYQGCFN